jgi:hypothetical protein
LTHCERSAQKLKDPQCDPYHVVSERQVDHGAIVGGEIRSESFHIAAYLLVSVGLSFRQGDRSVLFTVLREGSRSFLTRSDRCKRKKNQVGHTRQRTETVWPRASACFDLPAPGVSPRVPYGSWSLAFLMVEPADRGSRASRRGWPTVWPCSPVTCPRDSTEESDRHAGFLASPFVRLPAPDSFSREVRMEQKTSKGARHGPAIKKRGTW